jgi:hypothetical protein
MLFSFQADLLAIVYSKGKANTSGELPIPGDKAEMPRLRISGDEVVLDREERRSGARGDADLVIDWTLANSLT